jgi:excisionase family DNA binding protein
MRTTSTTEAERHTARRTWLTTAQAGERLGVSAEHVRKLIDDRELRAMDVSRRGAKAKEYRVKVEWCDDFERRRTSGPAAA